MPAKIARLATRPPFWLREVSIAVRALRLSCRKAGKARIFTSVRESSGESRFAPLSPLPGTRRAAPSWVKAPAIHAAVAIRRKNTILNQAPIPHGYAGQARV